MYISIKNLEKYIIYCNFLTFGQTLAQKTTIYLCSTISWIRCGDLATNSVLTSKLKLKCMRCLHILNENQSYKTTRWCPYLQFDFKQKFWFLLGIKVKLLYWSRRMPPHFQSLGIIPVVCSTSYSTNQIASSVTW